jgi:hypothetical protein
MTKNKFAARRILIAVLIAGLVGLLSLLVVRHFYTIQRQAIPRWAIGRYVFDNQFKVTADQPNPVFSIKDLQGVEAEFVADPFVFQTADSLYLFYEMGLKREYNGWTGVIALASSKEGVKWNDLGVVLRDSVIISFPVVYEIDNDYYMTIEGAAANNLRLFKATNFPTAWVCVDTLLTGKWSDPVIHEHQGFYYLFTSKPSYHDLHLFYSDNFFGPYVEHPSSPIVKDNPSQGRNAGKIFKMGEDLYRPVQDCSRIYGEKVRMMKVQTLSTSDYSETEALKSPILAGSGSGWNKKKMHTFNAFNMGHNGFSVITDGTPVNYEYRIKLLKRKR